MNMTYYTLRILYINRPNIEIKINIDISENVVKKNSKLYFFYIL